MTLYSKKLVFISKYLRNLNLNKKIKQILIILLAILVAICIVFISREKTNNQLDDSRYVDTIPAHEETQERSSDDFYNWETYIDNKYGFKLKYPPHAPFDKHILEGTNIQYITIKNGHDYIAVYPFNKSIDIEDPYTTIKSEPLIIADKQLVISGNKIEKIRITTIRPDFTNTSFLIEIPYPELRDDSITINYGFFNGLRSTYSEKLFDQIVSTFTFFDPGEKSVLNPTGLTHFSSEYLRLSFKYPSSWGQIEEKIIPGDTGRSYILSLDGNLGGSALGFGNITAGGRSKDFSVGRGGYIGDAADGFVSSQELCTSYYGSQGINCEQINPNIISQLVVPKYIDYCPSDIYLPPKQSWFSKRVWVNLTGQLVDGFMLEYSNFWSKDFVEMYSPDLICSKTNEQKFEAMVNKIANKILTGDIDSKTKSNIDGFDSFVLSIKVN